MLRRACSYLSEQLRQLAYFAATRKFGYETERRPYHPLIDVRVAASISALSLQGMETGDIEVRDNPQLPPDYVQLSARVTTILTTARSRSPSPSPPRSASPSPQPGGASPTARSFGSTARSRPALEA